MSKTINKNTILKKLRKVIRKETGYKGNLDYLEKLPIKQHSTKFYSLENFKLLLKGDFDYQAKFVHDNQCFVKNVENLIEIIENPCLFFKDNRFKVWGVNPGTGIINLYGVDFKRKTGMKYPINKIVFEQKLNKVEIESEEWIKLNIDNSTSRLYETAEIICNESDIVKKLNDLNGLHILGEYRTTFETEQHKNNTISTKSLRYKTFLKSLTCVECGTIGKYLALQRRHDDARKGTGWHYNLYGVDSKGNFVLMTKDHIIPKSKGGEDKLDNLQTMCEKCNGQKGDKLFYVKGEELCQ